MKQGIQFSLTQSHRHSKGPEGSRTLDMNDYQKRPRRSNGKGKSNTDGNGKESCGMSQVANVDQRVPEALNKFQVESEKVRHHFHDDPRALKIWDEYIEDVHIASSRNLRYLLCTYTQKSGLYEQLMRKSCTNTSVSMSSSVGMLSGLYVKLKQATRNTRVPIAVVVASVADAFAMGVGTQRSNLWKQQHGKETWR